MKNFPHKKDYAPACPISRKKFKAFATPRLYTDLSEKDTAIQLCSPAFLMRFAFVFRHRQILYRTKIKSPE